MTPHTWKTITNTSKTLQAEKWTPTAIQAPSLVPAWETIEYQLKAGRCDPERTARNVRLGTTNRRCSHIPDQMAKIDLKTPAPGVSSPKLEEKFPVRQETAGRAGKITQLGSSNLQPFHPRTHTCNVALT
jgi:hypothetical protein